MDTSGIDKLINQAMFDGAFPGAAISIGDKNGEIYRKVYGVRTIEPLPETMEEDTIFDLASITKVVSTTMVALCYMDVQGLKEDDTLDMFFDAPADKAGITIKQIMTHTSGLPAHAPLYDICSAPSSVCRTILKMPLLAPPGQNVVYSCLGYILLGAICEIVGGASLDELANRFVFEPLGLKNTTYKPKGTNFATTEYCQKAKTWLNGVVHDENARFLGGVSGNAGVFSNIGDSAVLAAMFANKGKWGGKTIVSQSVFERAVQDLTTHCEEGRGLGFAVKGRAAVSCGSIFPAGSYGHTGFTGTSMWVDAETSQYVVFLTNRVHPTRENNKLGPFRSILHDCCAKAYRDIKKETQE